MRIQNEFGRKKEIFWNAIDRVTFHKYLNMIIVSSNKKKIWISPVYSQILDFIPKEKYAEELKKYTEST